MRLFYAFLGLLWCLSEWRRDRVSYSWLNEQERLAMRNTFDGVTWDWPVEKEQEPFSR